MSTTRHHAIIVSCPLEDETIKAWKYARAAFEYTDWRRMAVPVSEVIPSAINGVYSFFVGPDGSYEDWPESDYFDTSRRKLIEWLESTRATDGSSVFSWIEVEYGHHRDEARILSANNLV